MSDDDVEGGGWRVRFGGGLLAAAPLSDALRLANEREDEKERQAAERAAEMRATAAAERLGELRMAGREPRTQQELFDQASGRKTGPMRSRRVVRRLTPTFTGSPGRARGGKSWPP